MNKVNFLPEDYIDKKAQQRTNVICLSLFLLVMSGVAGGFVVTEQRQRSMDNYAEQVKRDMLQASNSLKQMEVLEQKKKQMMMKASISALLMEPVPRSLLVATVTNNLPAGVSLLGCNLVSKEASKAGDTGVRNRNKKAVRTAPAKKEEGEKAAGETEIPAPEKLQTTIELTGIAGNDIQVAELIANLNRSELFSQVNLAFSEQQNTAEESLRHFKLMVTLDPNARASEADVALARQTHVNGM
jgi:Tfp pilus assembly protein PilN